MEAVIIFTLARRRFFFLLCLVFLLAGCSNPEINKISEDSVILAFGDSLTAGTGAGKGKPYPQILKSFFDCRIINSGIPGEVTSEGLLRLPSMLEKYKPSLVILCHGGNDILQKKNHNQTGENLRKMIHIIQEKKIDLVLIGVPEPGIFLSAAPFYEEIAEEFNIPFQGKTLRKILLDPELKSDFIHPNGAGYEIFARDIAELVKGAEKE
jgi:acyl-CoA thioesterase I